MDTIERAVIEFTQIQPLKSSHKTQRKKSKGKFKLLSKYKRRHGWAIGGFEGCLV